MRRREDFAIRRHTLNLYDGDYERLQATTAPASAPPRSSATSCESHLREIDHRAAQYVHFTDEEAAQ